MRESIQPTLVETAEYIRSRYAHQPKIGIILGSGLGNFVREIEVETEIDYRDIPHFPITTVEGHSGRLIFGNAHGKKIMVMAGRFHYYEGYTAQEVIFPVRVMKLLGINTLLLANAAGGMNESFRVGDLMIVTDHISLFIPNPLVGPNDDHLGPRFPDMSEPYSREIISLARGVATQLNIPVKEGVYAGVTGPTFETRAEYRLLHLAGADAVGMSTVQEVIAAVHAGLQVFAMSVITDIGIRDEYNTITHEEVLEAAKVSEPKLTAIFIGLIKELQY